MTTTVHILERPDVRLRYEVRGSGPLLVLTGAPMAAAEFAPLAEALAGDRTVVTHDPRGISGSVLADPAQDSTPELRAGDLAAILDDLGADSADVFGSSGGAVTGLALVARHPGRVRTLVAHEPPCVELLPDAAEQRAAVDDMIETFHRDGLWAAFAKFMGNAGFEEGEEAGPPPSEQVVADGSRFFAHELRGTTRYVPDVEALKAGRVVVGVGAESAQLVTYRTSVALAGLIGVTPVEFPGDHGGFVAHPEKFAEVLHGLL
ncbi:N-formylglutamate deformylase [[Actinomadura] parvosata subsp. kistnae]|uniref:Alpha/beta hydrolase n=1 Tax=[Actinomadura] parvosata subsp. kistnae TaxID=1909395 RepID=A0A1V0ACQ5_9ACTN|nr:alpha/beta hydrolase [Nonomuraea sp. ATCC 55076]AQZ67973.1 alpha/beta hydrolase [Nonomuraea sp. ATCC 55076]SPL93665.1 N-formylglutamate deformylase [Actinomadura parvosata subsp. kistnae]